jgi:hypothetical protein
VVYVERDEDQESKRVLARSWRARSGKIIAPILLILLTALAGIFIRPELFSKIQDWRDGGRHLVWTIQPEPQAAPGEDWASDYALPKGAKPPNGSNFNTWITAHHYLRVGRTDLRIELTNRRLATVRITALRAVIVRRGAAWSGTEIFSESAGTGAFTGMAFRLDNTVPVALEAPDSHTIGAPYFAVNPDIVLDHGQTMTVEVTGLAKPNKWFAWRLQATVYIGGSKSTVIIDDHGKPFQATGKARAYRVEYYGIVGPPYVRQPAGCPPERDCKTPRLP